MSENVSKHFIGSGDLKKKSPLVDTKYSREELRGCVIKPN